VGDNLRASSPGTEEKKGNPMATDARRRQKRLQRRKAKEKAKRRMLARQKSRGFIQQMAAARSAPIVDCLMSSNLWECGLGQVLISRRLPRGNVATSVFIVDVYCLGVKDCLAKIQPEHEYQAFLAWFEDRDTFTPVAPEYARKLIEEAVDYAAGLGFSPHPDYRKAQAIFGEIDAGACTEQFTFGQDGKPSFFAGPNDGPERCRQVLRTLEMNCGEGNYYYTIPLDRFPFDDSVGLLLDDESLGWWVDEPEWEE